MHLCRRSDQHRRSEHSSSRQNWHAQGKIGLEALFLDIPCLLSICAATLFTQTAFNAILGNRRRLPDCTEPQATFHPAFYPTEYIQTPLLSLSSTCDSTLPLPPMKHRTCPSSASVSRRGWSVCRSSPSAWALVPLPPLPLPVLLPAAGAAIRRGAWTRTGAGRAVPIRLGRSSGRRTGNVVRVAARCPVRSGGVDYVMMTVMASAGLRRSSM